MRTKLPFRRLSLPAISVTSQRLDARWHYHQGTAVEGTLIGHQLTQIPMSVLPVIMSPHILPEFVFTDVLEIPARATVTNPIKYTFHMPLLLNTGIPFLHLLYTFRMLIFSSRRLFHQIFHFLISKLPHFVILFNKNMRL